MLSLVILLRSLVCVGLTPALLGAETNPYMVFDPLAAAESGGRQVQQWQQTQANQLALEQMRQTLAAQEQAQQSEAARLRAFMDRYLAILEAQRATASAPSPSVEPSAPSSITSMGNITYWNDAQGQQGTVQRLPGMGWRITPPGGGASQLLMAPFGTGVSPIVPGVPFALPPVTR